MLVRQVAILYDIPKSTLSDHIYGKSAKQCGGPPTVLSATEENQVEVTCRVLADLGFPMNMDYVNGASREYLVKKGKPNPFGTSGAPGRDWW